MVLVLWCVFCIMSGFCLFCGVVFLYGVGGCLFVLWIWDVCNLVGVVEFFFLGGWVLRGVMRVDLGIWDCVMVWGGYVVVVLCWGGCCSWWGGVVVGEMDLFCGILVVCGVGGGGGGWCVEEGLLYN
jgi:hypothetical protein